MAGRRCHSPAAAVGGGMIGSLNQEVVVQHMTNGQIANARVLSDRRADPRATHPHQAPVPPQVLAWAEPGPRAEHIEPNRSTVWGPPGEAARLQNSHARIHSRGADRCGSSTPRGERYGRTLWADPNWPPERIAGISERSSVLMESGCVGPGGHPWQRSTVTSRPQWTSTT